MNSETRGFQPNYPSVGHLAFRNVDASDMNKLTYWKYSILSLVTNRVLQYNLIIETNAYVNDKSLVTSQPTLETLS